MKSIGLDNYEAFLLDLAEGRLNEEQIRELRIFALAHPELEIDLLDTQLPVLSPNVETLKEKDLLYRSEEDFAAEKTLAAVDWSIGATEAGLSAEDLNWLLKTRLPKNKEVFDRKEDLIKTSADLNGSYLAVACFEKCLNTEEKKRVELLLQYNDKLRSELASLAHTRLVADPSIIYPDKASLKKTGKVLPLFHRRSLTRSAAAILLATLAFFSYRYFLPVKTAGDRQIVSNQVPRRKSIVDPLPGPRLETNRKFQAPSIAKHKSVNRHSANHAPVINSGSQPKVPQAVDLPPLEQKAEIVSSELQLLQETVPLPKDKNELAQPPEQENMAGDYSMLDVAIDDERSDRNESKLHGFWKKAVGIAKQANRFGLKSVDGVEEGREGFRLAIFSLVVERH